MSDARRDVVVADLGLGNIGSVVRALARAGGTPRVEADPDAVRRAPRLVVPGQGAFRDCALALERGMAGAIRGHVAAGRPYFGICLGMQVLFGSSEEAPGACGLAHFAGDVQRLPAGARDPSTGAVLKVPHMGWNVVAGAHAFLPASAWFYFVHSYVCVPVDRTVVVGETEYPTPFASAVARDNVFACQFHPEKSQDEGEAMLPAIDLLGGKVVRLSRGRYEDATVYADDPSEPARRFAAAGAAWLHVVDLDGARDGAPGNVLAIERILAAAPDLRVQVGGGIRDAASASRWWRAGAERVVLGTAAIEDAALVRTLAEESPGGVVVAIAARGGEVATRGWLRGTGRRAEDVAREVDAWGVAAILYTNIDRDGTREGPDVPGTAALQRDVRAEVIASGGVGTIEHVRALRDGGVRAAIDPRAHSEGAS
jgi:phosphoribosylformimino-5-aminoimidazole carboxamide ribotide isomerase/imidazole glycerol phosphate synthase glutamine amidotransferase subunit